MINDLPLDVLPAVLNAMLAKLIGKDVAQIRARAETASRRPPTASCDTSAAPIVTRQIESSRQF
ncbi:MAG: hypothetical protein WDN30_14250 [Pararobbsia sp.]